MNIAPLTRETILSTPAGPDLNRAIADMLGYSIYHYDKDVAENCYYMLMDPNWDRVVYGLHAGERRTEEQAWADPPDFSGDIAYAWQVVEKMQADGHTVMQTAYPLGQHVVIICLATKSDKDWAVQRGAQAETAALAICRAALLSILQ